MPTKNAAAKKPAVRRKATRSKTLAAAIVSDPQPMPAPAPEPMPGPSGTSASRVVYLASCRNCCHVPVGVNAVFAVLIAIIFTLSAMLMAASATGVSAVPVSASDAGPVASR